MSKVELLDSSSQKRKMPFSVKSDSMAGGSEGDQNRLDDQDKTKETTSELIATLPCTQNSSPNSLTNGEALLTLFSNAKDKLTETCDEGMKILRYF